MQSTRSSRSGRRSRGLRTALAALAAGAMLAGCFLTDRGSVDKVVDRIEDSESCEELAGYQERARDDADGPEELAAMTAAIERRDAELDCGLTTDTGDAPVPTEDAPAEDAG